MATISPEAKAALLDVRALVLAEPRRLYMRDWIVDRERLPALVEAGVHAGIPACKTVGCIAGWLCLRAGLKDNEIGDADSTVYRLKLLPGVPDGCARSLFYTYAWPRDLRDELSEFKPGTPKYAAIVAEAIDRFIEDPDQF